MRFLNTLVFTFIIFNSTGALPIGSFSSSFSTSFSTSSNSISGSNEFEVDFNTSSKTLSNTYISSNTQNIPCSKNNISGSKTIPIFLINNTKSIPTTTTIIAPVSKAIPVSTKVPGSTTFHFTLITSKTIAAKALPTTTKTIIDSGFGTSKTIPMNSNSNTNFDLDSSIDSNIPNTDSNSNYDFDNSNNNIINITNIIKGIDEDSIVNTLSTKSVPVIATDKVNQPVMTATTKTLPTEYSFLENYGFDVPKNINNYSEELEKVNDNSEEPEKVNDYSEVQEKVNDYSEVPGEVNDNSEVPGEVNDNSDAEEEILGGIENSDEEEKEIKNIGIEADNEIDNGDVKSNEANIEIKIGNNILYSIKGDSGRINEIEEAMDNEQQYNLEEGNSSEME